MKPNGSLLTASFMAIALGALATNSNAAVVLLGGFDGFNTLSSPRQDASLSGIVVTLVTNGNNNSIPMQSAATTWGTKTFTPAPNTGDRAVVIQDTGALTITLQITNNNAGSLRLDQIHWAAKRDGNNSATGATIAYTAGNLTETFGTNSGNISLGDLATKNFDYTLSTMLTNDRTLATGESATFTWTSTTPTINQRLRIDNFSISGELIPEPSSALLGGLGLLALLRRRR